jgi:hypothetical protein
LQHIDVDFLNSGVRPEEYESTPNPEDYGRGHGYRQRNPEEYGDVNSSMCGNPEKYVDMNNDKDGRSEEAGDG